MRIDGIEPHNQINLGRLDTHVFAMTDRQIDACCHSENLLEDTWHTFAVLRVGDQLFDPIVQFVECIVHFLLKINRGAATIFLRVQGAIHKTVKRSLKY